MLCLSFRGSMVKLYDTIVELMMMSNACNARWLTVNTSFTYFIKVDVSMWRYTWCCYLLSKTAAYLHRQNAGPNVGHDDFLLTKNTVNDFCVISFYTYHVIYVHNAHDRKLYAFPCSLYSTKSIDTTYSSRGHTAKIKFYFHGWHALLSPFILQS